MSASWDFYPAVVTAIEERNPEGLAVLLAQHIGQVDPEMLCHAVHANCVKCVELLIPHCGADNIFYGLGEAGTLDRLECAQVLAQHCKMDAIVMAAGDAAQAGSLRTLRFFSTLCDFCDNESWPLQMACWGKQYDIIDYLYPLSNPSEALECLRKDIEKYGAIKTLAIVEGTEYLQNLVDSCAQRQRLIAQIAANPTVRGRKL